MNDHSSGVAEIDVRIAALPMTVFEFLTDPRKMVTWNGTSAELDPRPGGVFRVHVRPDMTVRGEFRDIVPGRKLVYTLGLEEDADFPPGATTVEITLVPENSGCRVHLRHVGLKPTAIADHTRGWEHYLSRLVSAAEGRDPGPDPWAVDSPDHVLTSDVPST